MFHGETERFIPPRKGQKHAMRIVREVLAYQPEPPADVGGDLPWLRRWTRFLTRQKRTTTRRTDIGSALEFCRRVLTKRSVLFVISDFIDVGYLPTMRRVNRRHDVVAAKVTDPAEGTLPSVGLVELRDAETGRRVLVDTAAVDLRKQLPELAHKRHEMLQKELRGSGIDLISLDTSEPTIGPLLSFLRMRERRQRR